LYQQSIFAQWNTTVTYEELSEKVQKRTLAAAYRYIYEKEARSHGKSRLFCKENHAYEFLAYTAIHFPDARFVHLVRDPRDMAATWKSLAHSGGVERGAEIWRTDQEGSITAFSYLHDVNRILQVKFEDLVTHFESTARMICDFLEIAFDENMREFHLDPLVRRNANALRSWKDLQRPLDTDEIGKYKTQLSEIEVRYVESLCCEGMEYFRYAKEYDDSLPIERLRSELPDPGSIEKVPPEENEGERYTKWRSALDRIRSRNPRRDTP
jgi:hypothetical protein